VRNGGKGIIDSQYLNGTNPAKYFDYSLRW
jgi:hypothetical protein